MKKLFLALAVMGIAALGTAKAHAGVSVHIGVPLPGISIGVPAPVYYAPRPVYVQPAPVVVYRPPVYCAPAPVYCAPRYYAPRVSYGYGYGYGGCRPFRHCW